MLVAHIGEVDARRLFAREAARSMFAYCTDTLGLSEHEAYLRITVARASRAHPVLLDMLADGRLYLSGVAKLVPHLTEENATSLLQRTAGHSVRKIEELIAGIAPLPDALSLVRRLPSVQDVPAAAQASLQAARSLEPIAGALVGPSASTRTPAPPPQPPPRPLSPDRYRIQFTADASFCSKLDRLKDLLCTAVPDGDIAALIDRAVTELVGRLEARRFGLTSKPGARGEARVSEGSRYVPADVRRAVYARDEGRCRFVGPAGARCPARSQLEYHHVEPYGRGGRTTVANIQMMCRTHNAHLAERDFGAAHMERFRKGPEPSRPPPGAPFPA